MLTARACHLLLRVLQPRRWPGARAAAARLRAAAWRSAPAVPAGAAAAAAATSVAAAIAPAVALVCPWSPGEAQAAAMGRWGTNAGGWGEGWRRAKHKGLGQAGGGQMARDRLTPRASEEWPAAHAAAAARAEEAGDCAPHPQTAKHRRPKYPLQAPPCPRTQASSRRCCRRRCGTGTPSRDRTHTSAARSARRSRQTTPIAQLASARASRPHGGAQQAREPAETIELEPSGLAAGGQRGLHRQPRSRGAR